VYVATGVLTTAYGPATSAALPRLVPAEALPRANRWLYGGSEAAHLIGPAVGGLLIAVLGAPQAVALDGVSFALCAACIAALPIRVAGGGATATPIRAGWQEIRRRPSLSSIAWLSATLWGTDTVFVVLFVPLVVTRLQGGPAAVGLLEAAVSAGAIVASLRLWHIGPAVPLFCLATAAMAVAHTMGVAYALQALAGFFTGVFLIRANIVYQSTVPDEVLGRALAARGALTSATRAGAALLAGGLALALGTAATFGTVGLAGAALSAVLVRTARRRDMLAA
jgi:DHA3 family macrolide efflux protein-like MFS transporter